MPLKISKTSFGSQASKKGNSIISKQYMVPISLKAPIKLAKIINYTAVADQTKILKQISSTKGETRNNTEASVSKALPEILAAYSLKVSDLRNGDRSALLAAVYEAFIEDRMSQEFSAALYNKVMKDNEKSIVPIIEAVNKQIRTSAGIIDQIFSFLDLIRKTNDSFSSGSGSNLSGSKTITQMSIARADEVAKTDPVIDKLEIFSDPKTLLLKFSLDENSDISKNLKFINSMTRTTIVGQIFQTLATSLRMGYSNLLLDKKISSLSFSGQEIVANEIDFNTKNVASEQAKAPYILELSSDESFGDYSTRSFFKNLLGIPAEKRGLLLSSIISNELLASAGIGRLAGTPLGNKFGAESADVIESYLGVSLGSSDKETSQPGSLTDFLVISPQGENRISSSAGAKRVLLLDGTNAEETNTVTNSSAEFLKTIIRNPTANGMKYYEKAITNAMNSAKSGLDFYVKFHSRDQSVKILNPRKLYTRVLDEISISMSEFAVDANKIKFSRMAELGYLLHIARLAKVATKSNTLEVNYVKRHIFKYIAGKVESLLMGNTSSVGGDTGASKTKTSVSVKDNNDGSTKSFEITTSQQAADDQNFAAGSFSRNDIIRFRNSRESLTKNFEWTDKMAVFAGILTTKDSFWEESYEDQFVWRNGRIRDVYIQMFEDEDSLVNRIAKVFVDCHNEALALSKVDNKDQGNFLNANKHTRFSNFDGGTLLAFLFETFLSVIELFVPISIDHVNQSYNVIQNNAIKNNIKQSGGDLNYVQSRWDSGLLKYASQEYTDEIYNFFNIQIKFNSGPGSSGEKSYKALKLLSQASKVNDFNATKNSSGVIPDLKADGTTKVTSKLIYPGISFDAFVENIKDLSKSFEIPISCLAAYAGLLDYTYQQTRNAVDFGAMLSGEKPATNPQVDSLKTFAKGTLGKKFLNSASDYVLEVSRKNLHYFINSMENSSKRNPKITRGEFNCLKSVVFEDMKKSKSSDLIFSIVGLPNDFITETLMPKFQLFGEDDCTDQMTIKVSFDQDGVLDDFSYNPIGFSFLLKTPIETKSFDPFSYDVPKSKEQLINDLILSDGMKGSDFIAKYQNQGVAKEILYNETLSHLLKKLFSAVSSADFFEENLIKFNHQMRSKDSKQLARLFSSAYGIDSSFFDNAFIEDGSSTSLDEEKLLEKLHSDVNSTSEGHSIKTSEVSLGEIEMFYDIFSTTPFFANAIDERVFSPSYFDKTIGILIDKNNFSSLNNLPRQKIVSGRVVMSDDTHAMGFRAQDSTQGEIEVNSYGVTVEAGKDLVIK